MSFLDGLYRTHEIDSSAPQSADRAFQPPIAYGPPIDSLATVMRAGWEAARRCRWELAAPLDQLASIWGAMEAVSPYVMALTLWDLGWLRQSDRPLTADDIANSTCAPAKYRPLMAQWLTRLDEVGIVDRLPSAVGAYMTRQVDATMLRKRVDQSIGEVDIETDYPGFVDYFKACVGHQCGLLAGSVNPQRLLFPAGTSRLVDGLYRLNPASMTQNRVIAAIVAAECRASDGGLRILEVGAGTGATTAAVLAAASSFNFEYRYTDISRFFLRRASRLFGTDVPFMKYDVLDIDQSPGPQGFDLKSFDVIIAVNTLHTAKHVGRTLNHLESLMSNRGIMIANETTTNTALQMVTFGHFEGVCHFEDERRQSNLPFLSCPQWESALRSAGLASVEAIPGPYAGAGSWEQHVLLAARGDTAHA